MKAILFTEDNNGGFNLLQEKIHLHLVSRNGINNFKYSADKWADVADAFIYESKLCLPIDDREPRHSLIMEVLTESEKKLIVDVDLTE